MEKTYILALDLGTTSVRVALVDKAGSIVQLAQQEIHQSYPNDGWVEEDPLEIRDVTFHLIRECLSLGNVDAGSISALGLANQRETVIVWDKDGEPVYPAIVWQCRRTAKLCEDLKERGETERVRKKTGLVIDAYFSATKIQWILDHVPDARRRAEAGELLFGTVDTWILWQLSKGKVHATDHSNASRTMLYNLETMGWDEELLELFDIPRVMLPTICSHDEWIGEVDASFFGVEIPMAPGLGDQQAALFGQQCFAPGSAKNTYGTGAFFLVNIGDEPIFSESGLVTTVAWNIGGKNTYALEGSVFIAGSVVQWMRDKLGIIESSAQSESVALSVKDSGGCYFVPAFTGLGAPYWDPYARGTITGMTQDTTRAHIVRAALESIAFQVDEVLGLLREASPHELKSLKVDGGAAQNDLLLQFQADLGDIAIERQSNTESTLMGAAYSAGLQSGFWMSREEILALAQNKRYFGSKMSEDERKRHKHNWHRAVERARGWVFEGEL